MTERPVQYFSDEYLQRCKLMTPIQILQFEENFRMLLSLQQQNNAQKPFKSDKKPSDVKEGDLG
jgi:hypothetical protein